MIADANTAAAPATSPPSMTALARTPLMCSRSWGADVTASASRNRSAAIAGVSRAWASPSSRSRTPRSVASGGSASARSRKAIAGGTTPRLSAAYAAARSRATIHASPLFGANSRWLAVRSVDTDWSARIAAAWRCSRARRPPGMAARLGGAPLIGVSSESPKSAFAPRPVQFITIGWGSAATARRSGSSRTMSFPPASRKSRRTAFRYTGGSISIVVNTRTCISAPNG